MGHDVLDLNSNIHPLHAISISFRKLYKNYESEKTMKATCLALTVHLVEIFIRLLNSNMKTAEILRH